jgi:hypothetical protein
MIGDSVYDIVLLPLYINKESCFEQDLHLKLEI